LSVLHAVRNNLIIPTVNEELDTRVVEKKLSKKVEKKEEEEKKRRDEEKKPSDEDKKRSDEEKKPSDEDKKHSDEDKKRSDDEKKHIKIFEKEEGEEDNKRFNICAEFFHERHEKLRALSKVCLASDDKDMLRRTVSMQILWVLLNDTQKKLSVVTADKAYYEEYFSKQRRLYNTSLNNVRFYSDMQSCADTTESHTLRKDNDVWLFVTDASHVADVFEKSKYARTGSSYKSHVVMN
jgi:hypothetical protein